jgi:osmotically-inducible protein OsmY
MSGGTDGYLSAHLEEALAEDGRVAEPGLHVQVAADRVVVSGTVSDPDRKRAVAAVLGGLVGERELVDLTEVAGDGPPTEERV